MHRCLNSQLDNTALIRYNGRVGRGIGQCYWQGHPEHLPARHGAKGSPASARLPKPVKAKTCPSGCSEETNT